MVTASILREAPSERNAGEAAMYRLVLSCNTATHEGEMQLAWAPVPQRGTVSAAVDGGSAITYEVTGTEMMGNGSRATTGPAAISLYEGKRDSQAQALTLPRKRCGSQVSSRTRRSSFRLTICSRRRVNRSEPVSRRATPSNRVAVV